jgi:hypothetical protein
MLVSHEGQFKLCPDTVGARNKDRLAVLAGIKGKKSPEPPEISNNLRSIGRFDQGLDHFNKAVAGVDIYSSVFIGNLSIVQRPLLLFAKEDYFYGINDKKSNPIWAGRGELSSVTRRRPQLSDLGERLTNYWPGMSACHGENCMQRGYFSTGIGQKEKTVYNYQGVCL